MAFVPAVPEAVAAGVTLADVLIALAAFLGWVVCLGLLFAYSYTFGYLLERLADVLDFHVLRVHVDLGGPIRALDNGVKHALSAGVSTFDHAMGLFFHWAGLLLAWMVNFAAASAQDTLALARWLTGDHLPKYLKWTIRGLFPLPWLTKLIAQQIAKALPTVKHIAGSVVTKSVTVVEKIPRALNRRLTKAEKTLAALAAALVALGGTIHLPRHVTTPGDVWRGLTKRTARLERRMHRVEGLFAVGVFAAVMAKVLGVTAKCLRSGNVGRTARNICGMDNGLLTDLLLGTTVLVGGLSIVQFAEELRGIEGEALDIVGGLIEEWPG